MDNETEGVSVVGALFVLLGIESVKVLRRGVVVPSSMLSVIETCLIVLKRGLSMVKPSLILNWLRPVISKGMPVSLPLKVVAPITTFFMP